MVVVPGGAVGGREGSEGLCQLCPGVAVPSSSLSAPCRLLPQQQQHSRVGLQLAQRQPARRARSPAHRPWHGPGGECQQGCLAWGFPTLAWAAPHLPLPLGAQLKVACPHPGSSAPGTLCPGAALRPALPTPWHLLCGPELLLPGCCPPQAALPDSWCLCWPHASPVPSPQVPSAIPRAPQCPFPWHQALLPGSWCSDTFCCPCLSCLCHAKLCQCQSRTLMAWPST